MDTKNKILPAVRPIGHHVVELHNTIRPHTSLGYMPPAPEVFVPVFFAWPATLLLPFSANIPPGPLDAGRSPFAELIQILPRD